MICMWVVSIREFWLVDCMMTRWIHTILISSLLVMNSSLQVLFNQWVPSTLLILTDLMAMIVPILTHWIPDHPIIVETDTLNYALGTILSFKPILVKSIPLHSIPILSALQNSTMTPMTKNSWLFLKLSEGSSAPIDVVMDHKNLEYFSATKVLTHWQACWSEFLSQFNLVIHFCPSHLGTKPNSLTRWWDVCLPKRGK